MAGNAHLTSPFMRFSVLFDPHNTPTKSMRPLGLGTKEEGLSTPPPVETVAWLDPNLPTPPTFAGEPMTPDESGSGKGQGEDEGDQEAEEAAEKGIVEEMLTPGDIKADPILSDLAKQQGVIRSPLPPPLRGAAAAASRLYKPAVKPTDAAAATAIAAGALDARGAGHKAKKEGFTFKARPAPATTTKPITGPRLSKAAALRMGVYQPTERERERAEGERKRKEEEEERSRKRIARQSLNIASLAPPTLPPKQNRTVQLRSGLPLDGATATATATPARRLKTAEEVAADKQQRLKEEKERRRASVALPASYSVPSIAPRMNRTAALRTGTAGPPISAPRGHAFGSTITPAPAPSASASANVNASKANNDTQAARDARAMPPPAFRNTKPQTAHAAHTLNKTAMLRTAPRPSTGTSAGPTPSAIHPSAPTDLSSRNTSRASTSLAGPMAGGSSASISLSVAAHDRSRSSSASAAAPLRIPKSAPPSTGSVSTKTSGAGRGQGPEVKQTKASLLRAAAMAKVKAQAVAANGP